jgi:hypothetical protein
MTIDQHLTSHNLFVSVSLTLEHSTLDNSLDQRALLLGES